MPYCTNDTFAQTFLENVENKKDKIVCSHLEIKGINLGNEIYTQHGVDINLLKKFKKNSKKVLIFSFCGTIIHLSGEKCIEKP